VVAVVQKGYQLNSRLVRPAMVMVAKSTNRSIDQKV
jgi:molecular chaperone GrpE